DGTVELTGIDGDISWGTDPKTVQDVAKLLADPITAKKVRMLLPPAVISQTQKSKILAMTKDSLLQIGGLVNQERRDAAASRLAALQAHIRALPDDAIVANFGKGADVAIAKYSNKSNSYLMRDADFFKGPER